MAKYHRTNMALLKDAIADLQENGSDLEYWNVNAMAKREGYTVTPKKSSFVISDGKQSKEYKFKDGYAERIWKATAGRRDMQASWAAKREKDLREANAAMQDLWNRL